MASYAGGTETTVYIGGLMEKRTNATQTDYRHLIPTPSGFVQHVRRSSGSSTNYLAADHLGSVDAVLASGSSVLVRPSFGAFGARRDDDWNGLPSSAEQQQFANHTRRGFTNHEMLDNVGLVHMNGRVYDPAIGRFISADPFIDGETNPQGWNRYAYVQNRPCSATDPTGFGVRPVISWINGIENVTVTASRIGFGFSLGSAIGGGGSAGSVEGGRAGAAGPNRASGDRDRDGDKGDKDESQEPSCNQQLIDLGNALARWSDWAGDMSTNVMGAGLVTTALGAVTMQGPVAAVGVTLTAAGGAGGIGAGVLQIGSGVLQGAGGGGWRNATNGILTLGTSWGLSGIIAGRVPTGYRTVSQRAGDGLRHNTAVTAGGAYDALTQLVDSLGPQQVSCP